MMKQENLYVFKNIFLNVSKIFFIIENIYNFRPCDVFAHCTNNIGSYQCNCFPGYEGDGHNCQGRNSL